MDLVSFFSQANNLPGNFIQIGFGKGVLTKTVFDAMNQSSLTKRETFIFDSFTGKTSSRLGQAMDMRFNLIEPNEKVSVVKGDLLSTLPSTYNGNKIACLLVNAVGYADTLHTLSSLHPYMVRDGLVHLEQYGIDADTTKAVDDFISQNKLQHQVFTLNNFTYLRNKVAPVFYKPTKLSKSDRAPEEGINVDKPKPIKPFEDRYVKKVNPKFKPKPVVREGLQVIGKKVSR